MGNISLQNGISVIKSHLKTAPTKPGVYRMVDRYGDILYVGKAKNIAKRIIAYTQPNRLNNRLAKMVARTTDMVFVTTRTEAEALLLEASLIKRFKPTYNILLKDDKSFPYILLREDHPWAQITKHRGAKRTKGIYFGPFASATSVNRTLNILQRVFQLRSCSDATLDNRSRACLLHQIKRCSAPCVNKVTAEEYSDMVGETRAFLEGKNTDIQKKFATSMQAASDDMNYELAAVYRDRLQALTQVQGHQAMVGTMINEADVIAAAQVGGQVGIQVFFYRVGQNWGHRAYFPRHHADISIEEVMTAFIAQFYDNKPIPRSILLSHMSHEASILIEALGEKAERKVEMLVPKRGKKAEIVGEATRNAKESIERKLAESSSQKLLLANISELFETDAVPQRIEIYDNSHIQGTNAVGAMVVAGPDGMMPSQYRKYNIKDVTLTPGDDFGMMREVMTRRFTRLLKEDGDRERGHWPNILLIDGGKGQLSAVTKALTDLGVSDVTLVAISKGPDRHAGREQFHMNGKKSFTLPINDPVLYYLQRLRDEAHRYAITTHRAKRKSDIKKSPLDTIVGVGPKRKKSLLNHFGSAKAVAGADIRDLESVEGVSTSMAQLIHDHFQS